MTTAGKAGAAAPDTNGTENHIGIIYPIMKYNATFAPRYDGILQMFNLGFTTGANDFFYVEDVTDRVVDE